MPQTLNMHHLSHSDAFSKSKSTKCEIFRCFLNSPWKKWEKAHICRGKKSLERLENLHIYVFGYASCNALCENFVWQVLFELWWSIWTLHEQKMKKKTLICAGIKCCKAWISPTHKFLGVLIAMKYVRTLCDKNFLQLWWVSLDFWQESLCIEFWNQV